MPTVLLVRHGESQANVGLPFFGPENIELTNEGWLQAEAIAQFLDEKIHPDLIVMSSFKRTKQTAQPTLALFPSVPREVWPVYEFTYLGSQHNTLSTIEQRRPLVERYWDQCKPSAIESPDSESFISFIMRVKKVLFQLKGTSYETIVVFSHEQFICAFLWWLQQGWLNLSEDDMKDYREFLHMNHIPNGAIVRVELENEFKIRHAEMITSHLHAGYRCPLNVSLGVIEVKPIGGEEYTRVASPYLSSPLSLQASVRYSGEAEEEEWI